jgi:hypothetical protein
LKPYQAPKIVSLLPGAFVVADERRGELERLPAGCLGGGRDPRVPAFRYVVGSGRHLFGRRYS